MSYAEIEWNNGVPRSTRFDDVYSSENGAVAESEYVFLQQNGLPQRWHGMGRFVIAETGFGFGLNFAVTATSWLDTASEDDCLYYISIERYPVSPQDIKRLAAQWPQLQEIYTDLLQAYPPPLPGMHMLDLAAGKIKLYLLFDDIQHALRQITHEVDAWYLDGFAPARNEAMWSNQIFELIARLSKVGGSFTTYTASGHVRRGLSAAGFVVQKVAGYASKRSMLKGFVSEKQFCRTKSPWFQWHLCPPKTKHATVIGSGLAGLSVAWSLVKRGWKVSLVDRHDSVAHEASGNPAGILMPRLSRLDDIDSRLYSNAYVYSVNALDALQHGCADLFWHPTGSLLVAQPGKLEALEKQYEQVQQFVQRLDEGQAAAVAGIEINRQGLHFIHGGWVSTHMLCEQLFAACGKDISYIQAEISSIEFSSGTWSLIDGGGEVIQTEYVVLATAAACAGFSQLDWLPLESVRGQLSYVQSTQASRALKCCISAERYITPEQNGYHVIGASYSIDGLSVELDMSDHVANLECISRLLPGIIDPGSDADGRVAFRAVSKDRVPVVGAVPDRDVFLHDYHDLRHGRQSKHYPDGKYLPGLFVSSGHGSWGLATCMLCGEIIAAMMSSDPVPVEKAVMDYMNPARFIIRELKRARDDTPGR